MKTKLIVIILSLALVSIAGAQPGRDVNWTEADSALHPFAVAASGLLGNYLYCFGNYLYYGYDYAAQALNPITGQWEESTLPPLLLSSSAGVATNDAIYLIGAYDPVTQQNRSEIQKFTPSGTGPTGTWTQVANYLFPARGVAASWDGGNFIYSAGGNTVYGTWSVESCKYDIANNVWSMIAPLPIPLNFAGGAFVMGKFYAIGGTTNGIIANTAFEYDPASNTWIQKASIPKDVVMTIYCTTFNDSLIFTVGGGGGGAPAFDGVQIYNPLTDTWYEETPLPEAICGNIARWIGGGEIISAGGYFYAGGPVISTTYRGTGFPTGSPSSHLTVTLVPFVQPIQIPASGGSFDFYVFVNNTATFSQEVEIWTKVIAPGGSVFGPLLGPATIDMDTGTLGWVRHQNVPGRWASGLYTYIAYVGDYPTGNIWASDSLQFTKLATGDGPRVDDWSCTGEEIASDVGAHGCAPASGSGATPTMAVMPNPFNPTTAISFELRAASYVNLKIYDTAGRLVTELVDGWRDAGEHQMTFDGSGLPSGIYFAKLRTGDFSQVQKMVLMK